MRTGMRYGMFVNRKNSRLLPSHTHDYFHKEAINTVAQFTDRQFAAWIERGLEHPDVIETHQILFPLFGYPKTAFTPVVETPAQKRNRIEGLQLAREQLSVVPMSSMSKLIAKETVDLRSLGGKQFGQDVTWHEGLIFAQGIDYLAANVLGTILIGQSRSNEEAWRRWIKCKLDDGVEAWYDSGCLTFGLAGLLGLHRDEANQLRHCHAPVAAGGKGMSALDIARALRRGEI
jgi:hypothetical protein